MHEMSIAMNVVEIATSQALQNEARRINSITLDIGSLAGVMIEALEFCFASVGKGTMAEGAELRINEIAAWGCCRDCGEEFRTETYLTACPACGAFRIDIIRGRELKIKTINVD
ncbi:MAG: hydrogenase maturation nickel metallochaperone HypA [Candidatus Neomarinimicrobiota bacterium]